MAKEQCLLKAEGEERVLNVFMRINSVDLKNYFGRAVDNSEVESLIGGDSLFFEQVSVVALSGQFLEVDQSLTKDDQLIDFIFFKSGRFSFSHENKWDSFLPRLVVMPHGVTGRMRLEDHWQVLVVRLPRDSIEAFSPYELDGIFVFNEANTLERSMYAFAATLVKNSGDLTAVEKYALEQLLLEMSGACLLNRLGNGWKSGSPHAVIFDQAKAIIAQQCGDPSLTPALVAKEVNSSLRQLQLIFKKEGTSLSEEIRARRAYLARSLLLDSRFDVLTIKQVAERSGFSTSISMRRALLDTFGIGPSETRLRRGSL